MNKFFFIIVTFLIISACSYEPILSTKNYDFYFENIETQGDKKINEVIKSKLLKSKGNNSYTIILNSKRDKNVISSNLKGDPTVFEIKAITNYSIINNNQNILNNKVEKKVNYNNINDKFELIKYEDNLIKNLSINISDEILTAVKSINK